MKIHEETHRNHLIRANDKAAMIFIEGSKTLEHRLSATSLEGAIESSKAWIDAKIGDQRDARRAPHVGTVEGYVKALTHIAPTGGKRLMLVAHSRADERKMTPSELADAAGWKTHNSANLHYGKLGFAIAQILNLEIEGDDNMAWTQAIGTHDAETNQWQMHDELADALAHLKIG